MIWKDFWLETVMVRFSGDQMEFWLGGQQKDIAQSTRPVWGGVMCGLGVLMELVDGRVLRSAETSTV